MNERDDKTTDLLVRWRRNCLRSQVANYKAATLYSRNNYWLGIPTIVLAAVVGTSVFSTIGSNVDDVWGKIVVGGISLLASVLAALQTFLKWGELAAKHRSTGAEYGSIKRQLDQMLAMNERGGLPEEPEVTAIRSQMDTLARETPEVPEKIWSVVRKANPAEKQGNP